jgi:hypothetical protein
MFIYAINNMSFIGSLLADVNKIGPFVPAIVKSTHLKRLSDASFIIKRLEI